MRPKLLRIRFWPLKDIAIYDPRWGPPATFAESRRPGIRLTIRTHAPRSAPGRTRGAEPCPGRAAFRRRDGGGRAARDPRAQTPLSQRRRDRACEHARTPARQNLLVADRRE